MAVTLRRSPARVTLVLIVVCRVISVLMLSMVSVVDRVRNNMVPRLVLVVCRVASVWLMLLVEIKFLPSNGLAWCNALAVRPVVVWVPLIAVPIELVLNRRVLMSCRASTTRPLSVVREVLVPVRPVLHGCGLTWNSKLFRPIVRPLAIVSLIT